MSNPKISINGREIGIDFPPYIVAELSANHNGKLENALNIIYKAYHSGADAIKLQSYKPDTLTLDCDDDEFKICEGIWAGKTLYQLYEEAHMPWEWHKPLFDYARKCGITIFSTPFDSTAVDLLEDLNSPAYKIASFEAIDIPLIKYAARTGKPMIISTGMADVQEIEEAVDAAFEGGCQEVALLHCVSGYPAPESDYNLRTIQDLITRFGLVTGLSDHTLGITTAITSIAMGAAIIEKHFAISRKEGGPDSSFSIEPDELKEMCGNCRIAWDALGVVSYNRKSSENANVKFRRSLYYIKAMNIGDLVDESCIKSVRPGYGLPPKYFDLCIGKRVRRNVSINTPVSIEDFESIL